MGGTLPLLVELQSKGLDSVGRTTALLYGINTLGATVGCYLTGFHLLPAFGSSVTNLAMVICNIAVGVVAMVAARSIGGYRYGEFAPTLVPRVAESAENIPWNRPIFVFLASALTGCAALILEMVWARQLAFILGGSTYTFTATLCVVLLGIGIGGLLYNFIEHFVKTHESRLEVIVVTIGGICFFTVLAQILIPKLCLMAGTLRVFRDSDFSNGLICFATGIVLELMPAIGMGILFPAVTQAACSGASHAGDVVGSLYLWNTFGAAFGTVLAFSVLVPQVGSSGAITIAIVAYLAASVLLEMDSGMLSLTGLSFKFIFGAALAVVLVRSDSPLVSNFGMYLYGPVNNPQVNSKLLYFKEGRSCNVLVTESAKGGRSLRVNGKVDASTGPDQNTQLGCAYLTRFLRPRANRVCVIGLGSGTTAGASLLFPDTLVTCFELEPAIYEGARHFSSINHSPWTSKRFEIVFDDARGAMNRSQSTYDLIISEPSNPWIAGVSNLYTLEFYRTAKRRLAPGGIVAQWVQTYNFTPKEFGLILRTMQRVFPHVALIRINDSDTILIASSEVLSPTAADIDASQHFVESIEDIRKDLVTYFGTSDVRSLLLKHFVLHEQGLSLLQHENSGDIVNTDINMRLEFDAPRQLFRQQIPDDERVDVAISRAIRTEWHEACVDRWKCSTEQTTTLADLLLNMIVFNDEPQVQRMIDLCRRVAPTEPLFGVIARIESNDKVTQDESSKAAELSQEMLDRIERLGISHWKRKRYEQAARAFRELVSIVPQSATSWMNLAVNYEALNQNDLANESAQKAFSIDPFNSFVQQESKRFRAENSEVVVPNSTITGK